MGRCVASLAHVALQAASLLAVELGSYPDRKCAPAVLLALLEGRRRGIGPSSCSGGRAAFGPPFLFRETGRRKTRRWRMEAKEGLIGQRSVLGVWVQPDPGRAYAKAAV